MRVKAIAPKLAADFEKVVQPPKEVKIDWLSSEYNTEFDSLKQSKDSAFKYLVKFKDRLTAVKGTSKEKMLVQQLESTAADIVKNKRSQDKLVKLAPKLASKLVEFARYKSKQRDQGRDL